MPLKKAIVTLYLLMARIAHVPDTGQWRKEKWIISPSLRGLMLLKTFWSRKKAEQILRFSKQKNCIDQSMLTWVLEALNLNLIDFVSIKIRKWSHSGTNETKKNSITSSSFRIRFTEDVISPHSTISYKPNSVFFQANYVNEHSMCKNKSGKGWASENERKKPRTHTIDEKRERKKNRFS